MKRMGRKRNKPDGLPARMYFKHGAFYFVDRSNKWIKLGAAKPDALRSYAELLGEAGTTFGKIAERYRRNILIKKAPATQRDQTRTIDELIGVFGQMPIDTIRRGHITQFRDLCKGPVAANRKLALLSHIFSCAVDWDLCKSNPVLGVKRNEEHARDRYITDAEFLAVYNAASLMIQVMMGLALITGQREADLLRIRKPADLIADGISFQQGKTKKRLVVRWSDTLRFVCEQALDLPKQGVVSTFLVCQANGQPYTGDGFRNAWQTHMRNCLEIGADGSAPVLAERFTFHDIRAKAGSDGQDTRLLGHDDTKTFRKHYQRRPERVTPVR